MREQDPDIQTIQLSEVQEPLLRLVSKVSRHETRVLVSMLVNRWQLSSQWKICDG